MKFLLDTHVLLWTLFEPEKLSTKARQQLLNQKNTIYVSSISFWEISIKYGLGKIEFNGIDPSTFPDYAKKMGFELLLLNPDDAATVHKLKGTWHRDPFDRLLIWQALQQSLTMITRDEKIAQYHEEGLKLIW